MMGPTHRLTGFLAGEVAAVVTHQPWSMVVMAGLIASSTSHGWASPDVDQTGPWVKVRQWFPDEVGRLLNHRELSHWWGVPAAAGVAAGQMSPASQWIASLLIVGWVSHLLGDVVFGEVPLWPGGPKVGLGLDTGGFLETGRVPLRRGSRWGRVVMDFTHRKSLTAVPFSPARVALTAAIAFVLVTSY